MREKKPQMSPECLYRLHALLGSVTRNKGALCRETAINLSVFRCLYSRVSSLFFLETLCALDCKKLNF